MLRFQILISVLLLAAGPALGALGRPSNVAATKHNLTSSGPGTVKIAGGGEVCAFCHTPHAASPQGPLWNRNDPGSYYQVYTSSTMQATVGQPNGSSRLCLSCHDGTIALAQTYNALNVPAGGAVYIVQGNAGYLGTDLSDDHPISFVYDSALASRTGDLRDPSTLPRDLPLDANGQLQCTTCHDPHDDTYGNFLNMDNTASALCTSCHVLSGWATSAHATSTALLSRSRTDNWSNLSGITTVQGAGCESCHRPHSAGGRQRLLRFQDEQSNCLNCHDGTVAKTDIAVQLNQVSNHDGSRYVGVHDPTENPATMAQHVTCVDCHNPHNSNASGTAQAPDIEPEMAGVSGISATGALVSIARYEYEVCFKCHSARNFGPAPEVNRVLGTNNIADEFSLTNASFHPVEGPGVGSFVPSLIAPYTTGSIIYCTACHSTDNPTSAKGPHGSSYQPLLIANYSVLDKTAESPQAYALCYTCHLRSSILGDQSFPKHKLHIVDQATPCSVCHDAHGVKENAHLINFDRTVVSASPTALSGPSYQSNGQGHGSCTLSCHGKDHNNTTY